MQTPVMRVALAMALVSTSSMAQSIDTMDGLSFRAPKAKATATAVKGRTGGAVRFEFEEKSPSAFFVKSLRNTAAFDRAEGGAGMPAEVRERIVARGRGIAGTVRPGASSGGSRRLGLWLSLAAIVLLTASTIVLLVQLGERDERLQAMRERVESNEMLLASARERVSGEREALSVMPSRSAISRWL